MNEQFDNSLKSRRRVLSRFHAQELILDYAEGSLDNERRLAMDDYLPKCKDTQSALASVNAALKYCDQLNKIEVAPNLVAQIETTKLGWAKWADQLAWRNWPEVMRWSAEAVVIAAAFAALISLLPMHKIARWLPKPAQEVILAEIDKAKDASTVAVDIPEPSEQEPMVAAPVTAKTEPIAIAATPTEVVSKNEPPTNIPIMPPAPEPPPAAKVSTAPTANVAALNLKSDKAADSSEEEAAPSQQLGKGPKGFVYRAFMSANEVDGTTNAVRDLVLALGGTKAGQVELGWRKNTGTYFHFSLPESNYEGLLEGLRAYSPVRIYKDPHWRVMPQGQIRLILFVEDLSLKK